MGKLYSEIDDTLRDFIAAQHVFFVATAPLAAGGHVNLSPKGLEGLHVLGPTRVLYVDFVGSGVETIAHLRENGRIVLMFCAFEGKPKIVRLHGRGRVVESRDPDFGEFGCFLPADQAVRSVIVVDVDRISDSCGFGVPLYEFLGQRSQLVAWSAKKGPEGLVEYQEKRNAASIDGLPGLGWVGELER
jgi:hypothetical protein